MADDLQFDRAESPTHADPRFPCAGCRRTVEDEYYVINGNKVCGACAGALKRQLGDGTPGERLLKAALLGILAALVSGWLWALFIVKTESMWGFVAIGLGYLVGLAVRKGSGGGGGRAFQALAVALAYAGVAFAYSMVFLSGSVKVEEGNGLMQAVYYALAPILLLKVDVFTVLWLGIALWEAWRLNRGVPIAGPFKLGGGPARG